MRALLLALILATPTLADPIPGADDPAFRAPFDRALQGDDPTALLDLHAAAEAGNTAAILALPAVNDWLRTTVSFADRKRIARVNGIPMAEAFAAASPTAALWALGEAGSDMNALMNRAFGLYAAGEPEKATYLFMTWLNQTGGFGDLPPGFFDQPVPPWAMADVVQMRLRDINTPPAEAEAMLLPLLKSDNLAGWVALAAYAGRNRPDYAPLPQPTLDRIARIIASAGLSPDDGERQMERATLVLKTFSHLDEPITNSDVAATTTALFAQEPEFQSLPAVCATICPQTKDQCTTAYVAGFGHPFGWTTLNQPLTSLMSTKDFFAAPRGRLLLLRSTAARLGDDPATSPGLAAARQIDACLADAILAANP